MVKSLLTDMGILTACSPSDQAKLPKENPVLTRRAEETMTLKVMVLILELKTSLSGSNFMVTPGGGSITALYSESTAPTFVTLLVRETEYWRFGMVMEGRFTSRMEGRLQGHDVGRPVTLAIAELL